MSVDFRRDVLPGIRNGLVIAACVLAVGLPAHRWWSHHQAGAPHAVAHGDPRPAPPAAAPVVRTPEFGAVVPSDAVRRLVSWVVAGQDNGDRPFAVIDKPAARLYVFEASGRLQGDAPVLLGSYKGDDTAPGVAAKPLEQLRPEERTTPAGRFVSEPGRNLVPENVVWIDYDAAVSMHPVRLSYTREHRQRRLDTPTIADNRISNGCVNVPTAFFHDTVWPLMGQGRAVVYVVPDVKPLEAVFPALAAPAVATRAPATLAQWGPAGH